VLSYYLAKQIVSPYPRACCGAGIFVLGNSFSACSRSTSGFRPGLDVLLSLSADLNWSFFM